MNKLRIRRRRLRGRKLLDRLEVIENPERSAVRREDHRVVARVQRDLVDPDVRQVCLQSLPALAAIERQKESGVGPEIEHVGIAQILGQRPRDFALEVRRHGAERLTEVVADEDPRLEVVEAMTVERHVNRALVESRRHDLRHERSLRHARHLVDDLCPGLAAIARHRQAAVVSARVEQARALGRFRQRDDRRPGLDAVVPRELDVAALHAHRLERVAILSGRQVGADRHPREPAIGRSEDLVGSRVDDLRIVRREEERRVPMPAQRGLARTGLRPARSSSRQSRDRRGRCCRPAIR